MSFNFSIKISLSVFPILLRENFIRQFAEQNFAGFSESNSFEHCVQFVVYIVFKILKIFAVTDFRSAVTEVILGYILC